ncbi:MAG: hypothetical protein ACRDHP_19245, partial [Ktedonobacterales bacterium]
MTESRRDGGDEREEQARQALPEQPPFEERADAGAVTELEPGWLAARSLVQLRSDELLAIMLRPSFRPARDLDLVPVAPCTACGDGGLRTAGSVRGRRGRELVRACDTCG